MTAYLVYMPVSHQSVGSSCVWHWEGFHQYVWRTYCVSDTEHLVVCWRKRDVWSRHVAHTGMVDGWVKDGQDVVCALKNWWRIRHLHHPHRHFARCAISARGDGWQISLVSCFSNIPTEMGQWGSQISTFSQESEGKAWTCHSQPWNAFDVPNFIFKNLCAFCILIHNIFMIILMWNFQNYLTFLPFQIFK